MFNDIMLYDKELLKLCVWLLGYNNMSRSMLLYKYQPIDEHTRRIFTHYELYFSNPNDFNDPFDCKIPLSLEGSYKQWMTYIKRIVKERMPELNRNDYRAKCKELYKNRHKLEKEVFDGARVNPGLFCLSELNDNILMWSHYAKEHSGVCIGFDASDNNPFFARAQQVNYSKIYPTTTIFDDFMKRMEATVLTKSSDWIYEKEWRITDPINGPGLQLFLPTDIKEVIFGCNTSNKDKDKVKAWISSGESNPVFYDAKIRQGMFKLDLIPHL